MALVAAVILAAAGIGLGLYRDHNLHHDERMTKRALSAGYVERHAAVGGVTVNYAEGPSDGLALLLIHGQGMEWEDYSPVLPALAKRYHVFAVDCLGHGESARDPSLYSCVAGGDVLISFARQVIGGPYAVSGHSSGGILAAYVAAHDSANVLACILEDPPFFSVTPDEVQGGREHSSGTTATCPPTSTASRRVHRSPIPYGMCTRATSTRCLGAFRPNSHVPPRAGARSTRASTW